MRLLRGPFWAQVFFAAVSGFLGVVYETSLVFYRFGGSASLTGSYYAALNLVAEALGIVSLIVFVFLGRRIDMKTEWGNVVVSLVVGFLVGDLAGSAIGVTFALLLGVSLTSVYLLPAAFGLVAELVRFLLLGAGGTFLYFGFMALGYFTRLEGNVQKTDPTGHAGS